MITVDSERSEAETKQLENTQVVFAQTLLTELDANKSISPTSGLKDSPVYIYSGMKDTLLPPPN